MTKYDRAEKSIEEFHSDYVEGLHNYARFVDTLSGKMNKWDYSSARTEVWCANEEQWDSEAQEWTVTKTAAEVMAEKAKAIGGSWDKEADDYSFRLVKHFGPHSFSLVASRDAVCTPRVVGTKTVTERKLPEGVDYEEVTVTKDVIEWDCSPILSKIPSGKKGA